MGPRVFISSTYYDLKYVREDLAKFVESYRFQPILFENGDVGYEPGRPLDESCYSNISRSDMVILIVGGSYGSPATGEMKDEFNEYMSITKGEFQAAKEAEIPIFVFIDSAVEAEYQIYIKNQENIESQKTAISFNATQNVNVFRFINLIRRYSNVVVTSFRKTCDIKNFLANQWANYFYSYLVQRKENPSIKEIENSLAKLSEKIEQINLMVDGVAKKLLAEKGSGDYDNIKDTQTIVNIKNIILDSFCVIPLYKTEDQKKKFVTELLKKIASMMKDGSFGLYTSHEVTDQEKFYSLLKFDDAIIESVTLGAEFNLRKYEEELQDPETQSKVVDEIMKEYKWTKQWYDSRNMD